MLNYNFSPYTFLSRDACDGKNNMAAKKVVKKVAAKKPAKKVAKKPVKKVAAKKPAKKVAKRK